MGALLRPRERRKNNKKCTAVSFSALDQKRHAMRILDSNDAFDRDYNVNNQTKNAGAQGG